MSASSVSSPDAPARRSKPLLDPIDRTSEILFGLIMVLTFTGTLSVVEADRKEIRMMLVAAIGCNLAWGFVDAVMYLMTRLSERRLSLVTLRNVRGAHDAATAHRLIADAMPEVVGSVLRTEQLEMIRIQLNELPEPPSQHLTKQDFLAAAAVFLWVFLLTFPVVIPFLLFDDAGRALRISNAIAIVLFFLAGFYLGRASGFGPWRTGLTMVGVGLVLVGITIVLGG